MSREEGFQGYSNYSTWAVHLWLSNTYELYQWYDEVAGHFASKMKPREAAYALANAIEKATKNSAEELGIQGFVDDLLGSAVESTDWLEVAAAFLEPHCDFKYNAKVRTEKKYNGWTNYATWAIYSFLNGDYSDDPAKRQAETRLLLERAAFEGSMQGLSTGFQLDEILKNAISQEVNSQVPSGTLWQDLALHSVGIADYKRISDALLEGSALKNPPFQGHRSWNAWNVALWIGNDEGLYNLAIESWEGSKKRTGRPSLHVAAVRFINRVEPKTPDGAPYSLKSVKEAIAGLGLK